MTPDGLRAGRQSWARNWTNLLRLLGNLLTTVIWDGKTISDLLALEFLASAVSNVMAAVAIFGRWLSGRRLGTSSPRRGWQTCPS
jgi:hypothetical protein